MRKSKLIFFLCLGVMLFLFSCGRTGKKSYDEMGTHGLTTRTENLQANLRSFLNKGVLIGQQYGTLEGVGWSCDSDRSDFYSICNDRPACSGYEIRGIEKDQTTNVDSISFVNIRRDVLRLFRKGGLILLTWTAPNPKGDQHLLDQWVDHVAAFLNSLQDAYLIKAPVVLFPYPLDGKSWYAHLSPEDYKHLFEQTVERLKDQGVTNALYGLSFAGVMSQNDLEKWLPTGVDVLNGALFQIAQQTDTRHDQSDLTKMLQALTHCAQEHNIVPGLMTGIEGLQDTTYFSKTLLGIIHQYRLSYVMLGRNTGEMKERHYYAPYPGVDNALIADFVKMYNDPGTIFLSRLNGLYLKKEP